MMKTFLQLTDIDGEPILVDLDGALVIEPVTYRNDGGLMASGTQFTYQDRSERTVSEGFNQVVALIVKNANVVRQ